jgi:1-pyrroline-5-carboxylate dehydrogenase
MLPLKVTDTSLPGTTAELDARFDARFDAALVNVRTYAGAEHAMLIGGVDVRAVRQFEVGCPIDQRVLLGRFQAGDAAHAAAAVAAARAAFPAWSATPWTERVAIVRRAAANVEARALEVAAVVALEVGKSRAEALAEVQETAGLMSHYCDRMEAEGGYARMLRSDARPEFVTEHASVMKPRGPWLVIAAFNHPFAQAAGPAGAALVAGNTVVLKPASPTPWSARLLALALRDAGVPPGAFNLVTGPGASLGQVLASHGEIAGITFSGSGEVGMQLVRSIAEGPRPRPCVAAIGGKGTAIVSRRADLADAVAGVVRSAFGLAGQAGGACSRVYVEHTVFADFVAALHGAANKVAVGDPTRREPRMGPLISAAAVARYEDAAAEVRALGAAGAIVEGGLRLDANDLAHGHFVAPTIARAPLDHPLWSRELFAPFVLVAPVDDVESAIARTNALPRGTAAGFYGSAEESERFFAAIETGAAYANRRHGATTGAWPAFPAYGDWKGAGAIGWGAGSLHHLPQYLREQSQVRVRRASS